MKMFSVHVNMGEIISKAARDIDKYDAEKQKKIRKVIADGTKDTKIRAVQMAPKGPTGKLKKGIKDHLVSGGREGSTYKTTIDYNNTWTSGALTANTTFTVTGVDSTPEGSGGEGSGGEGGA